MARFISTIFRGGQPTVSPALTLRVQTSLEGIPIPILLAGQMRMAGNLIWYGLLTSSTTAPSTGGKGGVIGAGGKGNSGTYYYTASFLLALCEGPVVGIANMWENGSLSSLIETTGQFIDGDYAALPWEYFEVYAPAQALAYRGTACAGFASVPLGSSPEVPQLTFEVASYNGYAIAGNPDGDLTEALYDFLTNPFYGAQFPPDKIGDWTQWTAYCLALGLVGSPVVDSPVTGASFMQSLLTATDSEAVWSNGVLKVVPYGDQIVVNGAVTTQVENYEVPTPETPPPGAYPAPPSIIISYPGRYVGDEGVTYTNTGVAFSQTSENPPTIPGQYALVNGYEYVFSLLDVGALVTISYLMAQQSSYNPVVKPVWDFTTDDFTPNQDTIAKVSSDGAPLIVVRTPRDQMITTLKLEYLERSGAYNPVDIEVKDEAAITAFGRERPSDLKQCHFFCTAGAAQMSATLQLIRGQIARLFQWTAGPQFILLDVMDVVTVTDAGLGLYEQPVRIVEIQENIDGTLTFTGEEFLGTVGAPLYGTQPGSGYAKNYNVGPGPLNPPIIFEPTDELASVLQSGGGLVVCAAVSGAEIGTWGGAYIWASADNVTYEKVGVIDGPARMGVLASALPPVSFNPVGKTVDDVNAVSVNLSSSGASLRSGSAADELALNTKCWIDGEVVAYRTATLTSANNYVLTHLVRGAFGSEEAIVLHPVGAPFVRLDGQVFSLGYDQSRIGSTIYFKFQSFNIFQGGLLTLDQVAAHAYTLTGAALASPLPDVTNLRAVYTANVMNLDWDEVVDFRQVQYQVRQGADFASALTLGTLAHPPFAAPGDGVYWVSAIAQPAPGLTVYSEDPPSLTIEGAALVANVALGFDEQATGWGGLFSAGVGIAGPSIQTGAGVYDSSDVYAKGDVYGGANPASIAAQLASGVPADLGAIGDASPWLAQDFGAVGNPVSAALDLIAIQPATIISQLASGMALDLGGVADGVISIAEDLGIVGGFPAVEVDCGGVVIVAPIVNVNGTYEIPATHWIDIGRVAPCGVKVNCTGTGVPIGQDILANPDILGTPDFLGAASAAFVDVYAEIAIGLVQPGDIYGAGDIYAQPNVYGATVAWGPWAKFSPGVYVGRQFKFRVILDTEDPGTIAACLAFAFQVAVPARADNLVGLAVPAPGLAIVFEPNGAGAPGAFLGGPNGAGLPIVSISIRNAQSGDYFAVSGLTLSGMNIQIFNASNVGVARTCDIEIEGY